MRIPTLLAVILLAGCPPKTEPPEAPVAQAPARAKPGPLESPAFQMPDTEVRTLSNGLEVVVATNDEVPLVDVRLVLEVGGWADPEGQVGLAGITFDMLNEGAGDLTAEDIARELKQLGSSLYSGADVDSASVGMSGLVRNLEPTLDLWAKVLTEPTFPAEEWTILQKRYIADLRLSRENPVSVARDVAYHVLYGDRYRGRMPTEEGYGAIAPDDMRAFYQEWVGPENGRIFVGGDVTADEIVPLLEARIGSWDPEATAAAPAADIAVPEAARLYFVDKPGAAQSVLRVMIPIGTRADDDYFPLFMANQAFGGVFTARLNMNLREDKGYTYGARCFVGQWDGPGMWGCQTSVQTDVTLPALEEIRKEITEVLSTRPITPDELAYYQSMEVNGFPASYETTGSLLDEQADIWRYGLPEDWAESYLPNIRAVTAQSANEALAQRIDPNRLTWFVVGDREQVFEGLQGFGLEIVELDRDGNAIEGG